MVRPAPAPAPEVTAPSPLPPPRISSLHPPLIFPPPLTPPQSSLRHLPPTRHDRPRRHATLPPRTTPPPRNNRTASRTLYPRPVSRTLNTPPKLQPRTLETLQNYPPGETVRVRKMHVFNPPTMCVWDLNKARHVYF